MPRKRSSLWLRPLELLSIATGARPKKVAGRARPAAKKAAPKVASAKTPQKAAGKITRRASTPAASVRSAKRTRTAHAARAASDTPPGTWLRSFHSAGPSAGRLVNHLAYALYLPAAPAATAALPVVVMLHGCKQTAESFAAGTRMCRLAERAGFVVLFPEQAKTAHAHRCWHWHGDATQSEAAAVVSLVDAIVRHHGFDRDRIYVAGLSAGAGLAAALAIRYPDRFAAVGLHSGPAIAPPSSAMAAMSLMRRGIRDDPLDALDACADVASYPGMPALVVHGALDTVVTDRNAAQLGIAFARLNRLVDEHGAIRVGEQHSYARDDAAYVDYLKAGRLVVRVCIVHRLPHAWSGGDPREPFHSATGPDASAMFWHFFRRQRRKRPA
ncbi:extracellular catalytic domain type 1 short-chain-length polyhydroxyalkanoate depolymerase [Burkholderia seminalis]|uniref:extracellular catalytic domain type 1 short-chain-length polyhydroxyalkanoate depolymerase n=1 Tax=Burkholderia seminalis TaxID=488731 RepID=UPI00264BF2D2|nr:PHB depolymerase family esterase [Burkholderia seminalis]MDN7850479.1 PHB depolymerase family esterase [Burkholderia seminalis]